MQPDDVLQFWFGERTGPFDTGSRSKLWFGGGDAFDQEIRERFGDLHARAVAGELDGWADEARGALALVIVLDQFSRNLGRGDGSSFAHDAHAQRIMRQAIDRGLDEELDPAERVLLYMPLMHAESAELQAEACRRFEALAEACPEERKKMYENFASYAHRHRVVVDRFGRFPHRNERLGREHTAEEKAYLEDPDAEHFG